MQPKSTHFSKMTHLVYKYKIKRIINNMDIFILELEVIMQNTDHLLYTYLMIRLFNFFFDFNVVY